MGAPTITIEAPPGLGRRGAIEWRLDHLSRTLDRLDADEDAAREGLPPDFVGAASANCFQTVTEEGAAPCRSNSGRSTLMSDRASHLRMVLQPQSWLDWEAGDEVDPSPGTSD